MLAQQSENGERLAAGDLVIDTGTHQVFRGDQLLPLPKLSFHLLLALARAAPNVLLIDHLIAEVWEGRVVSNETVTQRVKLLRQLLGDDAQYPTYVGVVRGEGYRLLVDVHQLPAEPTATGKDATPRRYKYIPAGLAFAGIVAGILAVMGIADWSSTADPEYLPADPANPRIAVLPFVNLSDQLDQRYFADGLTEEVITALSRIPHLHVAGRSSSFAFKGHSLAVAEIAAALHVDHLVEGSVRWENEGVRVSATLVSVEDGFQVWSESYVSSPDDIFNVQEQIAEGVASALKVELGLGTAAGSHAAPKGLAFAHFLRGQALFWNHTPETTEQAIDAYQQAVALDPDFVRAWVGLSFAYGARSRNPAESDSALADMARAADHAVALAPDFWEAQAVKAWVLMSNHAFADAERTMSHALMLREQAEDQYESITCPVACYFQQLGRVSDALAEAQNVAANDPLSPSADESSWLYLLGRREEAIKAFQRYQQLLPRPHEARTFSFWLALESDDPAEMESRLKDTPFAGKWGKPELMLAALVPLTDPAIPLPRGTRATLAIYAARHGDNKLALRLLEMEYLHPGFGAYFLIWHPLLAPVRATPEFAAFVAELGLVDAWRSTGEWGDYCREDDGSVVCH